MAAGDPPTAKQLATLRRLAGERGQTFVYPQTRRDASGEIRRLLAAPRSHRAEIAEDRAHVQFGRTELDAARVRVDEVEGYGSTARWKGRG